MLRRVLSWDDLAAKARKGEDPPRKGSLWIGGPAITVEICGSRGALVGRARRLCLLRIAAEQFRPHAGRGARMQRPRRRKC